MRLVVQSNLGCAKDLKSISEACARANIELVACKVIPFSDQLPDIDTKEPTVFYGAVNWINKIHASGKWTPGTFLNPDLSFEVWDKAYGNLSFNHGAQISTLNELASQDFDDKTNFFIRPCSDNKEFSGQIMTMQDITEWDSLLIGDAEYLASVPILYTEPNYITEEYRFFIVDERIVAGSRYRVGGRLSVSGVIPVEAETFAKTAMRVYSPQDIFVLDVCKSGGEWYVLELGSMNSAGFYESNVFQILYSIKEYLRDQGLEPRPE